ncbi:hypothetical protein CsatA_015888 [Cannabis sativa]
MKSNERAWDMEIITDLFNTRDQACILNIPLNNNQIEDRVYWCKEASGMYTVQSAYKLLQLQKQRWQPADSGSLWNKLWKIKVPPKVLNLLWRALPRCSPTLSQLHVKHVQVQRTCLVCNMDDETEFHALVSCPFPAQCWQVVLLGFSAANITDFTAWFDWICASFSSEKRGEIAMIYWSLWGARIDLVWKGDGAVSWVKPIENVLKISVDATTFDHSSSYGFGLVARDHHGYLVEAKTVYRRGTMAPDMAEALAIKEASSWIKEHE